MTDKNEPVKRRWKVRLYGYDTVEVEAPTIGAARYHQFKLFREAGYFQGRWGFLEFLTRVRAWEVEGER